MRKEYTKKSGYSKRKEKTNKIRNKQNPKLKNKFGLKFQKSGMSV